MLPINATIPSCFLARIDIGFCRIRYLFSTWLKVHHRPISIVARSYSLIAGITLLEEMIREFAAPIAPMKSIRLGRIPFFSYVAFSYVIFVAT